MTGFLLTSQPPTLGRLALISITERIDNGKLSILICG